MVVAGLVTADRVAAAAMVGQFLVLVVAALLAGRQVRGIRAQVDEARELRLAQARPFVVVDFELERPPFMYLVIANLGKTMARNVRIDVDPPLASSQDARWPVPLAALKLFAERIPSLAPGKRHVTFFDSLKDRKQFDLPDSYQVRLSYEWDGGDPITDEQRLDLDLYHNTVPVQRKTIHDVSTELEQIRRRLEDWSARPGLLVIRSDELEARRQDWHQQAQEAWEEEAASHAKGVTEGRVGPRRRLLAALRRLAGRG